MSELPILILSGPPGSGTTTIADLLVTRRERAVHLESDHFFRFIKSGFIKPWEPESHEQNRLVMGIVADAAGCYASAGYFTVIDGIISPKWFLDPLRESLKDQGFLVSYVILRPSLLTAVRRAATRETRQFGDPAVIAQLFDDFTQETFQRYVIDNDFQSPAERRT